MPVELSKKSFAPYAPKKGEDLLNQVKQRQAGCVISAIEVTR